MENENHYSWEEVYYMLRCAIPFRGEGKLVNDQRHSC
jgi:hypothetical protein